MTEVKDCVKNFLEGEFMESAIQQEIVRLIFSVVLMIAGLSLTIDFMILNPFSQAKFRLTKWLWKKLRQGVKFLVKKSVRVIFYLLKQAAVLFGRAIRGLYKKIKARRQNRQHKNRQPEQPEQVK